MSKKIERDEKGHPILRGGRTFGHVAKPRNKGSMRTNDLKDQASYRILMLLKKGPQADKFACEEEPVNRKHIDALAFQNALATSPKIVQFAFHRSKLATLKEELTALLNSNNKRKIEFSEPTIKREIEETEEIMLELFNEIKMERRVIKES